MINSLLNKGHLLVLTTQSFSNRIFLALSLCFSLQGTSLAATDFIDIAGDYWAKRHIDFLSERGVIAGYADQSFQPNREVTRAEFAVILAKSQGLLNSTPFEHMAITPFKDLLPSHWAAPSIMAIVSQGWMAGYPNQRFEPNRTITLAEMYAILAKAEAGKDMPEETQVRQALSAYRDASELPSWARIPVAKAILSGITVTEKSSTKLSPNQAASRANVANSVAKLANPQLRDIATQPASPVAPATTAQQPANEPVKEAVKESPEVPEVSATHQATPIEEGVPAVNLSGTLRRGENPNQWQLIRADGRVFPLQFPKQHDFTPQAGAEARVTGNLDAVTGTADAPIVTVQTLTLTKPYEAEKPAQAKPEPAEPPHTTTTESVTEPVTTLATQEEQPASAIQATQADDSTIALVPQPEQPKPVSLYFPNLANLVSDPALMLGEPTERPTVRLDNPKKAIEAILNGPNEDERRRGYFMDQDLHRLSLGKLSIDKEGLATVMINAPGNFQFENTSVAARMSEQIRRTLKQFANIQSVKVSVTDPKNKAIWISP